VLPHSRHGQLIASLTDWHAFAPPASAAHWQDGRSARELARAWTAGTAQGELGDLLATADGIGG
jgi:hypothetical protein